MDMHDDDKVKDARDIIKKSKDFYQIIPASELQVLAMEYKYKYRVRLLAAFTSITITALIVFGVLI